MYRKPYANKKNHVMHYQDMTQKCRNNHDCNNLCLPSF